MQAEGGFIMKLKQFVIVLVTCVVIVGILIGCTSRKLGNVDSKDQEERILTFLVDSDVSLAGVEAVVELAKKELDMEIIFETRPGGSDGDNIVKTRLASGDMSDILVYNSGALLSALNPEEYFIDLSDESFASKLEPTYAESVSVGDKIYGIPLSSSQAGAILYSKDLYKKYGLEVPKTWDEFILNCDVLYEAGETAIVGTFADSWTSQVPFLADNYNIVSQNPEFVEQFEIGNAKYETTPVALRSFEKLADTNKYYNADYLATTYDDGCDIMANGEAGHWIMLTQALSNIYELYGVEAVDKIGVFAVPGDDTEDNGLTLWMPTSIYGNKNSGKEELIKEFLEFYVSDMALDAYTKVLLPDGPYCIAGYELPDEAYKAVTEDMQAYFDNNKTASAMEFLTPVKGADAPSICQELGSGQTTAQEAAAKYDSSCKKQALQLGLDW